MLNTKYTLRKINVFALFFMHIRKLFFVVIFLFFFQRNAFYGSPHLPTPDISFSFYYTSYLTDNQFSIHFSVIVCPGNHASSLIENITASANRFSQSLIFLLLDSILNIIYAPPLLSISDFSFVTASWFEILTEMDVQLFFQFFCPVLFYIYGDLSITKLFPLSYRTAIFFLCHFPLVKKKGNERKFCFASNSFFVRLYIFCFQFSWKC